MSVDRPEHVDLQQLSLDRSAHEQPALPIRRHLLSRYVAPIGLLAAFAGLFCWSARSSFLPAHDVTVTPVIITRAEVQQSGTPLFQAAGWIEPRPTPVVVTSLAEGVVEEIYAVEGQYVERGKPVAKLFDTDAKLAAQQADANLRLCEADVRNAEATLAAAHTALENPNELKAALAEAESSLAETELVLGNLPYMIEAANARRQLAEESLRARNRPARRLPAAYCKRRRPSCLPPKVRRPSSNRAAPPCRRSEKHSHGGARRSPNNYGY